MDTSIILRNVKTGGAKSFRLDHATKLLAYEKSIGVKCWELPPDSNYTFKDGKLIKGPSDRVNKAAKEREGNPESQEEKNPA